MRPEINPSKSKQQHITKTETDSLKGTFTSVLVLGTFIVICWFAVFALFLNRA